MNRSTISRCARLVDHAGSASVAAARQRQILAHRHFRHDALDLAILGAEADAARDRLGSAARGLLACPSGGSSRHRRGSAPKMARAISVRPEPSNPARPTIWPARTFDARVAHAAADLQSLDAQHFARRAAAVRRKPVSALATAARSRPSIAATSCSLSTSAMRPVEHGAAVAHDRDAVADLIEFVEPMADEDDRHALARAAGG